MVPLAARAAPSAKSCGGAAAMLKIVEAVFEGREWDGRGREAETFTGKKECKQIAYRLSNNAPCEARLIISPAVLQCRGRK